MPSRPRNIAPEDLIHLVIAVDTRRRLARGEPTPHHSPWERRWIEPFFNLLGLIWGGLTRLLPWPRRQIWVQGVMQWMGRHQYALLPETAVVRETTVNLARRLQQTTGQWPAMLVLTSHPPTTGPQEWLRFALLQHGMAVADAVVDASPVKPGEPTRRCHPECLLAIDPFALDTLSVVSAGIYAGWMHAFYLAWDRQARMQSLIQRVLLLRRSSYAHISWRLLGRLRRSIPVAMAFSGGLPHNARLLYAAREFIQRLPLEKWPIRRLAVQKRFMELISEPAGDVLPTEQGWLPTETLHKIQDFWQALGIPAEKHAALLAEFIDEFQREMPYRERLLNVLIQRLVMKGQPLLLLGAKHLDQEPYLCLSEPWGCIRGENRDLQVLIGVQEKRVFSDVRSFAKAFGAFF